LAFYLLNFFFEKRKKPKKTINLIKEVSNEKLNSMAMRLEICGAGSVSMTRIKGP
jgi:hypothetical protein